MLLAAAPVDLIVPGLVTDLIGAALFLMVFAMQRWRTRREAADEDRRTFS